MAIVSALFMMISSMVTGVAVLRDFDHRMESILFINPISKRNYLMGRFFGSLVILIFIFSSVPLGMSLGELMPWVDQQNLLPYNLWSYVHPFLFLVLPTLFFGGAIFFITGTLSRKLIVVYIQGFVFLILYVLAMSLAVGSDDLFWTALLEPFTFQSVRIATQAWTTAERNILMVPIEGLLLYNRLLWLAIGIVTLIVGHYLFDFKVLKEKTSGGKKKTGSLASEALHNDFSDLQIPFVKNQKDPLRWLRQLIQHTVFSFKWIVKEVPFWAIVICGAGILVISSFDLGTTFGVNSYPKTYLIVGELQENTLFFFLAIAIFYSGELIWKERGARIDEITDALPISDAIGIVGKFVALISSYTILFAAMILTGILFQALNGYYHFEIGVYLKGFFLKILPFLVLLTMTAFFFQVIINHKFIAHIAVVIFVFVVISIPLVFQWDHWLFSFGGGDLQSYSDMNGYGHFLKPYLWLKAYWLLFGLLLLTVAIVFSVRGKENIFLKRWKSSRLRVTPQLRNTAIFCFILFVSTGSFIFYHTNVLNRYWSIKEQKSLRAQYEKELKNLQYTPQPEIAVVYLEIDLDPEKRNFTVEGHYLLHNTHHESIEEIHIQKLPNDQVSIEYFEIDGGTDLDKTYENFGYSIYRLRNKLASDDTLKVAFRQEFVTKGFMESSNTDIVFNGTFFDNFYLPTIGYNRGVELRKDDDRKAFGLSQRPASAAINDSSRLKIGRSDGDGEEINFEVILSTSSDQTAIAPGRLHEEWKDGNRNYFHYKMDQPMSNFFSIVSARYETVQDTWVSENRQQSQPVNLEIFYHKGHEYNLDRMMHGMKRSFDYFTEHLGPYPYQQMRILEVPVYKNRAQSFPNTVPVSEDLGFIMNIDDEEDLDMVFFIMAHELAHQWWGHQVNPANVQGQYMINESLAQYSALMVMKKNFQEEKILQLLKLERKRYFKGRNEEGNREMPLALVQSGQEYIYYSKGLINFYALQDYLSEDSLNRALKRFIEDWNSFDGKVKTTTPDYPTTIQLLDYIEEITPDSLKYVVEELFEAVVIHDHKLTDAAYRKVNADHYEIDLSMETIKYKMNEEGEEVSVTPNDWVEISIYAEDEETLIHLKKYRIVSGKTQLNIQLDQLPSKVVVDPNFKLLDLDLRNNEMKLVVQEI